MDADRLLVYDQRCFDFSIAQLARMQIDHCAFAPDSSWNGCEAAESHLILALIVKLSGAQHRERQSSEPNRWAAQHKLICKNMMADNDVVTIFFKSKSYGTSHFILREDGTLKQLILWGNIQEAQQWSYLVVTSLVS